MKVFENCNYFEQAQQEKSQSSNSIQNGLAIFAGKIKDNLEAIFNKSIKNIINSEKYKQFNQTMRAEQKNSRFFPSQWENQKNAYNTYVIQETSIFIINIFMEGLLKFGRSIREFENTSNQAVFMDAETYPIFFERHLVHPARRLKVFINDPNANIRAFYFQYLILCFEVQNKSYDFYMDKLQSFILDSNFTFIFLESDDEKIFNDQQFKRFFLEFLAILESGQFLTVEQALNKYPIADLVFVYFFRSLLIYAQLTNDFQEVIEKNKLFGFLLQNFSVDAAVYEEKCLKFFEAEVFVYEESPYQIYMAYMEIDTQIQSNSEKNQQENQAETLKQKQDYHGYSDKHCSSANKKVSVREDNRQQNQNSHLASFRKEKSQQLNEQSRINSEQKVFQYEEKQVSPQQNINFGYEVDKRSPSSPNFKQHNNFEESTYCTQRTTTVKNHQQATNKKIPPITEIPPVTPIATPKGIGTINTCSTGFGNVGFGSTEAKTIQNTGLANIGTGIGNTLNIGTSPEFNSGINITSLGQGSRASKLDSPLESYTFKHEDNRHLASGSPGYRSNFEEPLMYEPFRSKSQTRTIRQECRDTGYKDSIMKKLNVSKQFTDSITLMKISQPYRSNIKQMKSRSREYRESLIRAIK